MHLFLNVSYICIKQKINRSELSERELSFRNQTRYYMTHIFVDQLILKRIKR